MKTQVLCILFLSDAAVNRKKKKSASIILLLYTYFHQVYENEFSPLRKTLNVLLFFLLLLHVFSLLSHGILVLPMTMVAKATSFLLRYLP